MRFDIPKDFGLDEQKKTYELLFGIKESNYNYPGGKAVYYLSRLWANLTGRAVDLSDLKTNNIHLVLACLRENPQWAKSHQSLVNKVSQTTNIDSSALLGDRKEVLKVLRGSFTEGDFKTTKEIIDGMRSSELSMSYYNVIIIKEAIEVDNDELFDKLVTETRKHWPIFLLTLSDSEDDFRNKILKLAVQSHNTDFVNTIFQLDQSSNIKKYKLMVQLLLKYDCSPEVISLFVKKLEDMTNILEPESTKEILGDKEKQKIGEKYPNSTAVTVLINLWKK